MVASEIRALFAVASRPEIVGLAGGMPYVSALPLDVVGDMFDDLVAKHGAVSLQYGSAQGDPRLREQICEVMALSGISAHADDLVVTVGSQGALDLIGRIFLDPGDIVLAEAPSYVGALGVFASYQSEVVHVPTDDQGLQPEALRETLQRLAAAGKQPKLLYTVPNYHNPAGVTLTASRRAEVLEIARAADVLILEDDPYGLLGFDQEPLRAMQADAPDGVVYLGSFSKTFAPGLRIGWALAPQGVKDKLVLAAEAGILSHSAICQLAISKYLDNHAWRDQIKSFRELYRERRDAMLGTLDAVMPESCTWTRPAGGFYVWLTVPEGIDTKAMLARAIGARVAYVPGSAFFADGALGARHMRLSYCFPEPDRIREGIRRLGGVIEEELEVHETFGTGGTPARGLDRPPPNLA
ncbi:MAG: aminotransferase class I/II-fold pyridoxal phosphate-dependent enzyme [Streptosporangiales bacterium]|nr:aminotransferase class I/II-fold pyridoxal phosphate-dependent enzyme [Streptosporangiales bacterium]